MSGVNQAIIVGNIGKKPELKTTNNGKEVCNFSVAVNEKWKEGERTEWVNVVTFGGTANFVGTNLDKGSQVCVLGRLQTRKYEDKSGNERTITEVIAQRVEAFRPQGTTNEHSEIPF